MGQWRDQDDLRVEHRSMDSKVHLIAYVLSKIEQAFATCNYRVERERDIWTAMTHGQVVVYRANWLLGSLDYGGFMYLLETEWHPHMSFLGSLDSLNEVGGFAYSHVVKEVFDLFPRNVLEGDAQGRAMQIEGLQPAIGLFMDAINRRFYALHETPQPLAKLIADYIHTNKAWFFA
ncbi:MAG: DUF4375 domain-containing protein [Phycisphaerales bacterium]|nr:DUF4375 domain-containing protein [Phycisphaerales bacterium]